MSIDKLMSPRKRRRPVSANIAACSDTRCILRTAFLMILVLIPEPSMSFCPERVKISSHRRYCPSYAPRRCVSLKRKVASSLQMTATNVPDPLPPPTPPSKFRTNSVIASAFGLALAGLVTYDLATSTDDVTAVSDLALTSRIATENILDVALPTSATDVVAVALGEGIGGLVGVGSTFVLSQAMRLQRQSSGMKMSAEEAMRDDMMGSNAVTEAIAGFDYFLTRAVASPLLLSIGLDPFLASIGSVLVASIPYELVKLAERVRQRRRSENELLNELLREERDRRRRGNVLMAAPQTTAANNNEKAAAEQRQSVDLDTLKPAVASTEFDFPELITDIIKWLEYDVLKSKFSGELFSWNGVPLSSGLESGVFGFMAALSSQLYLDACYQNTNLGPEEKSLEARTRSPGDLITLYATRCFGTAALFATYESFKIPVRLAITGLISGGYEACVGSEYFDLCVETIEEQSPSLAALADGASIQAEFRALIVAYASLFQRVFGGEIV